MRKEQGFTLIELMIVIAIIGILAAIAIPAYQDYAARAQASESLTASAGVRTEIAEWLALNGVLPDADDEVLGVDTLAGRYFDVGGIVLADEGVISVTFARGVHAGNSMELTPQLNAAGDQIARWECDSENIIDKHIPSACRPLP